MAKSNVKEIKWLPDMEEHDYPVAESYLNILYSEDTQCVNYIAASEYLI
jgi:hypothetical protein